MPNTVTDQLKLATTIEVRRGSPWSPIIRYDTGFSLQVFSRTGDYRGAVDDAVGHLRVRPGDTVLRISLGPRHHTFSGYLNTRDGRICRYTATIVLRVGDPARFAIAYRQESDPVEFVCLAIHGALNRSSHNYEHDNIRPDWVRYLIEHGSSLAGAEMGITVDRGEDVIVDPRRSDAYDGHGHGDGASKDAPSGNQDRPYSEYQPGARRDARDGRSPAALRIFVSHSHEDNTFCRELVAALRAAGADVWYDEHDQEPGQLTARIQRELRAAVVFVPVLSPASLTSSWVKVECDWAHTLWRRDRARMILPVTARPLDEHDLDDWLFLEDFARVEAPGRQPYPASEAARRTIEMLHLAARPAASTADTQHPITPVGTLLEQGRVLYAHGAFADALVPLMRATFREPNSVEAWITLGATHRGLEQYEYALQAYDRALTSDPGSVSALDGRGLVLLELRRYEEANEAFERALALEPDNPDALHGQAQALAYMGRSDEASDAEQRARELDPSVTLSGIVSLAGVQTDQPQLVPHDWGTHETGDLTRLTDEGRRLLGIEDAAL